MSSRTFEGDPCVKCGATLRYSSSGRCVACQKAHARVRYKEQIEKIKHQVAEYRRNNPDVAAKISKTYREQNRDIMAERTREWRANNLAYVRAQKALRRATESQATPKWLTDEMEAQILDIYRRAQNCADEHHVDHIIPLKSNQVCGLHVPWNLQILPARENLAKGNRFVSDW